MRPQLCLMLFPSGTIIVNGKEKKGGSRKNETEQEAVMTEVRAWAEQTVIPTYEVGEPEKNPIFLEKRVYQGSSGKVYPYPTIDKIGDRK